MFTAQRNCGNDVFHIARDDYANGDLAVVRGVHGVECAAAGVETDFSAEVAAQGRVQ